MAYINPHDLKNKESLLLGGGACHLVRTDVSEERVTSKFRVENISEPGTLTVTMA
jgi:hypothetical protein